MLRFAAKRLAFMLVVLFGVSVLTFSIVRLAPGDPARLIAGPQAPAQTVARIRKDLGLDQPLWRQYARYAGRLLHFDLGVSNTTGKPVLHEILTRAPASLELMGAGLAAALALGVPLGVAAALNRGRMPDRLARTLAVLGSATPAFWLGLILIVVFYRHLYWFPASDRFTGDPPRHLTGLLTLDALLAGDFNALRTALAHLVLPAASLALLDLGFFARLTRNQLLGVLSQDYIRTARAAGLSEGVVVREHALRNALSPLVGVVGAAIAAMLYGSVSVETVFGWPGAGLYVVEAIFNQDMPVILGFAVLTAFAYVLFNTLADLAYAALDPRVRAS
jgi:peptide/nickel transport system permease protein